MVQTFFATLTPMLELFSFIFIGYILKKKKILPDNADVALSRLVNFFFGPALSIYTFSRNFSVEFFSREYHTLIYSGISLVIAILISLLLSNLFAKEGYTRNIYRYALTFGNIGYMGNAVVLEMFGEKALYHYMIFTLPLSFAINTWGLMMLIPRKDSKSSILKNLWNPPTIGLFIGMLIGLSGLKLPAFLNQVIKIGGDCMGPTAMLLTGVVIGSYPIAQLLKNWKVYIASALRLIVLPAFFLFFMWAVGGDKDLMTWTCIAYGVPLGMNTVVYPAAYGGDTSTGASMAMISHTLCVITIPLLYAVLTFVMG